MLARFVELRNASRVPLSQISRLSLEQYNELLTEMLRVQSGGLIPVQGINVSDKSSGAGGDITVTLAGEIALAIEVTERPIDKARVVSTFNTKVVRAGIQDYLFVYSNAVPAEDARKAARTYFSQGHEINFVQVKAWILNNLVTLGSKCRAVFTKELLALLDVREVPASVKIAWNDLVKKVVAA